MAIDPQRPNWVYVGFPHKPRVNIIYDLDRSTDGGLSWAGTGYLFNVWGYHEVGVSDILVHPHDSRTILVAVSGVPPEGGGVWRSDDGGATWANTRGVWAKTLALDPANPDLMYFGSQQCGYVFRSEDRGTTWDRISPCWVEEVRDLAIGRNGNVYAATDDGVWRWDGTQWTPLTGLPGGQSTAIVASPDVLYAGTASDGVFVSRDGGNTWNAFNEGLGNRSITALAISPGRPKVLYAGTAYGGVWSRAVEEVSQPAFADVPADYWALDAIEALVTAGVTAGCGTDPPTYCPESPVTREQMAIFLLRSLGVTPPPCTTAPFSDVLCSSPFAAWIAELVRRGITAGCGGGLYCPASPVTREQMAIFLLRAIGVSPPACVTPTFGDMACSSIFAKWIEELVARGITAGCGGALYCPLDPVTRAQMAVFLVKTFNLPF